MKVKVYYNLHKKCFSVVSLDGDNYGRVIDHVQEITLENARFKVSEAGRQRVLKERKKNVHAYVVGTVSKKTINTGVKEATYNPYKYSTFVYKPEGNPIHQASIVKLTHKRIYVN